MVKKEDPSLKCASHKGKIKMYVLLGDQTRMGLLHDRKHMRCEEARRKN